MSLILLFAEPLAAQVPDDQGDYDPSAMPNDWFGTPGADTEPSANPTDAATPSLTDALPPLDLGLLPAKGSTPIRKLELAGVPKGAAAKRLLALYRGLPGGKLAQDSLARLHPKALQALQAEGYAEASLDTAELSPERLAISFQTGPLYHYQSLTIDSLPPEGARILRADRLVAKRQPFSWQGVQRQLLGVLRHYENLGYPFARFTTPSVAFAPNATGDSVGVSLRYGFIPGERYIIDSIRVEGDMREHPRVLYGLTKLRPGDPYQQSAIDAVPQLLRNTIYFDKADDVRVEWDHLHHSATLVLPVQRRKANRFDALLGLLPPRDNTQQLQITGLLDLQLVSAFRWGEVQQLHFEQLPNQSQQLNLSYRHPFLFSSPVSAGFEFSLLKQDTLFLRRETRPSFSYALTPWLSARLYWELEVASLLGTASFAETTWPPPPVLDSRSNIYGMGLSYSHLDNRLNPTRGWDWGAEAGFGSKNILRNAGLKAFEYDSLLLRQPRLELRGHLTWYRRIFGPTVLVLSQQAYWLRLREYFDSDLAFIGGARRLRGFNENEFPVSLYSLSTLEYRLLLDASSYLGIFFDYAYLELPRVRNFAFERPLGIGLTMSFSTAAGLLSVSYAIGGTDDRPLQPARGRIHLGLVNAF